MFKCAPFILFLLLASCSNEQKPEAIAIQKATPNIVSNEARWLDQLNKKYVTPRGRAYIYNQVDSSRFVIRYGLDSMNLNCQLEDTLELCWVDKNEFSAEGDDYLFFHIHGGSDTWYMDALPFSETDSIYSMLWMPCAFNENRNVWAGEYSSEDTVFYILNLKTGKKQWVLESKDPCPSAFSHYCFDSVKMENNRLKYVWFAFDNSFDSAQRSIKISDEVLSGAY